MKKPNNKNFIGNLLSKLFDLFKAIFLLLAVSYVSIIVVTLVYAQVLRIYQHDKIRTYFDTVPTPEQTKIQKIYVLGSGSPNQFCTVQLRGIFDSNLSKDELHEYYVNILTEMSVVKSDYSNHTYRFFHDYDFARADRKDRIRAPLAYDNRYKFYLYLNYDDVGSCD